MKPRVRQELLELVRRNYDDIAADFSRTRQNLPWPETERLIKEILSSKQPNNRFPNNQTTSVLDLGCGNGRMLQLFTERPTHYLGIEQSAVLADYARAYIAEKTLADARVITASILDLPALTQETFDLILLIAVLPHLPGRETRIAFLRAVRERLAPQGRLLLTCWDLHASPPHRWQLLGHNIRTFFGFSRMDFNDMIFPWKRADGTPISDRYYHAYTERSLRKELTQAGFQIERLYSDNKNIYAVAH